MDLLIKSIKVMQATIGNLRWDQKEFSYVLHPCFLLFKEEFDLQFATQILCLSIIFEKSLQENNHMKNLVISHLKALALVVKLRSRITNIY